MTLLALLLAAVATAQAAGPPAAAQPVAAQPVAAGPAAIAGKTAAPDPKTAQAALSEAGGFARGALKCGDVGGAKASLMPKGWIPADPNFRIGPKRARYERWEIQTCGRSEPFLVVFWKDKKAGPQFQVAHPFPAGSAKKKR